MCQWNHPLAAISTMRWPGSEPKPLHRSRSIAFHLVVGKHPLAETTDSVPSGGRNYTCHCSRIHIENRGRPRINCEKGSTSNYDAVLFLWRRTEEASGGRPIREGSVGQNGHQMGALTLCSRTAFRSQAIWLPSLSFVIYPRA